MAELTREELAAAIEEERAGLQPGQHLQVCLWFAATEDVAEMDESPEVWPVGGVTVTAHDAGGGIARGGDHIDFAVESDDTRTSAELAGLFLAAADGWAAENLCSPWEME
jgi:hypothetical protein